MSTIEDRLSAALEARAQLVNPEDLRPSGARVVRVPVHRHPATYILAAAACTALVLVPVLVFGGDGEDRPAPPVDTPTAPVTPNGDKVAGSDWPQVKAYRNYDVDGDGTDDVVVTRTESGDNLTDEPWRLEAQLGSGGTTAVLLDYDSYGINPIRPVDLDGDGADEIFYYRGTETEEIGVLQYFGGELADLAVPGDPGITSQLDGKGRIRARWIDGGVLYSSRSVEGGAVAGGTQPQGMQYEVDLWSWQVVDQELRATQLDTQCVDALAQYRPFPCEGGQANPFADLFPDATGTVGVGEEFALDFDGGGDDPIVLENASGQPIDGEIVEGDVELVVTLTNGGERRATVPAGWQPELVTTPVASREVPLLLVRQEGGDGTTLTVFQFWNGELRAMPVVGDVPFGNGFFGDGVAPYPVATWLSEEGALYTRVATEADPASTSFDVWRWNTDGEELVPEELGRVCIDFATTPVEAKPC